MDTDKMTEKYKSKIQDPFVLMKVDTANHKPDMFCIGPKHVGYASDRGGMLGEEAMSAFPCCSCHQSYSTHTHDTIMFLKLSRNATQKESRDALTPLQDEIEKDGIDGFVFVDNGFTFLD